MNLTFDELYQKLYAEHRKSLEKMRRELALKYSLIIGFCILLLAALFWIFKPTSEGAVKGVFLVVFFVGAGLAALCRNLRQSYVSYYKDYIIKSFIDMMDLNLAYSPEVTYSKQNDIMEQYYAAKFNAEKPTSIAIDDLITGTIGEYPIEICDMNLYYKRGKYGKQLFLGLFAQIETNKSIEGFIKITKHQLFKQSQRKKMDDKEFERHFDVASHDRSVAMQYLTADVMSLLVDFKEKSQIEFDMFWSGTDIVIRFHTGGMFEPNIFDDSMDKDTLENYMEILSFVFDLNKLVEETVRVTEI